MSDKYIKLHSIQLVNVTVIELFIKANQRPENSHYPEKLKYSLLVGHTSYDQKTESIRVAIKIEIGTDKEQEDYPYSMRVELSGEFCITDESAFPMEHINDWAKRNAPILLYPYIREHVYALTVRCGFRPLILPLLQLPSVQSNKPKKRK